VLEAYTRRGGGSRGNWNALHVAEIVDIKVAGVEKALGKLLARSSAEVEMSVFIVRAFVRLRAFLATHKELAEKLAELGRKLASHDEQIVAIIDAITRLMAAPSPREKRQIGFGRDGKS